MKTSGKIILKRLYSAWAIFSMGFFFMLLIVPLLLMVLFPALHKKALKINYIWARCFFAMAGIFIERDWRFTFDKKQQFILCANHFSYLDIPVLGLFPKPFKFVGKSSLARIPVFGYMYRSLHITVNRASYKSRANSLLKAKEAIENGFNLGFFPEGGIRFSSYPQMVPFKDGAFKLAVEYQLPIIPVTLPDNYYIQADDDLWNITRRRCRIILHEPIWPDETGEHAVSKLKQEVFRVIQSELHALHNYPTHENNERAGS